MISTRTVISNIKSSVRLTGDSLIFRGCSTVAGRTLEESYYRTSQNDPTQHSINHLGRIYTVDPKIPKLFGKEINPKENYHANNYFGPRQWLDRCSVLRETAIMVREPAVQIINCIQNYDLSRPALRFVLYGRPGSGKSVTLSHLTHYGHSAGFITLTFSQIKKWITRYYETAPSSYNPGQVDHIMNSNIFLKNFKQANLELLSDPRLVTHKDYTWSVREKTVAGSPLLEIIDIGCERLAFAADALNVLIRELKLNCTEGNCKLMVVCDGVNSLFAENTLVHREKTEWRAGPYYHFTEWVRNCVKVDECSVLRNFKKLFMNDYNNAIILTSACYGAKVHRPKEKPDPGQRWWISKEREMVPDFSSHLPFSLLGEEGWRLLDPFVPVEVENYSEAELDAMIDYYIERGWLEKSRGSLAARQEIHFLTGRNPGDLFKFSPAF